MALSTVYVTLLECGRITNCGQEVCTFDVVQLVLQAALREVYRPQGRLEEAVITAIK